MTLSRRQLISAAAITSTAACGRQLDYQPPPRSKANGPTSRSERRIELRPHPRALVTGCAARSIEQAKGEFREWIDGVAMSDWTWADLEPTPGSLDRFSLAQLVSALDWCNDHKGTSGKPLKVRLRINAGYLSPAWVKEATGGAIPWATPNGVEPGWQPVPAMSGWAFLPGGVPQWWTNAMADAYAEFQSLLADAIGSHPALAEICMTLPSTQYAEPCIRQGEYQGNAVAAYRSGYNRAVDLKSFTSGYAAHAEYWSPLGIATNVAFSPYQRLAPVTPDAGAGDTTITLVLMNHMVRLLGRLTVWSNNGFRNPAPATQANAYASMYSAQFEGAAGSPPVCIAYQTKTLAEMQSHRLSYPAVNLPATVQQAIDVKATGVELPVGSTNPSAGVDYLSASAAAKFNEQFARNATRYLE